MSIPRIDQFSFFVKVSDEFDGFQGVIFSVGCSCKVCFSFFIVDNVHTLKELIGSHSCNGRVLAK